MNVKSAASALESLGSETRLIIFRSLVRAGPNGLAVGKLKDKVGIPASTLSHHLSHLVNAKLVSQTREGRVLRCTADYRVMHSLVDYLVRECCQDDPC